MTGQDGYSMSEPRTEAGRYLAEAIKRRGSTMSATDITTDILAIEEEAARPPAGGAGLRAQVLDLGGRLDGFDHWRSKASAKPSDPDDIRWECQCGYAGSPDTVRRHWAAMILDTLRDTGDEG